MPLSVLQWNVWFEESIDKVLSFLQSHPADVICLQELTKGYIGQSHVNTWQYLAAKLDYRYHFQEIPIITPTAQWSQANAIFSKHPIANKHSVWLHRPEDDSNEQYRGYVEVTLKVDDKFITIGTTHVSFGDNQKEVDRLVKVIESRPENYILTGDFNALPHSPIITEMLKHLQNAGPDFEEKTWTTKPFSFDGFEASSLDWRLDYVFASPDMEVTSAEILKTDISDHLPILVKFQLS